MEEMRKWGRGCVSKEGWFIETEREKEMIH